jgi:nicotinamide phosphoribosyltransferase
MKINPMLLTDFYKISHHIMSEKGTEKIYSTFTPRASRIEGINEVVFFGLQGFIKDYLIDYFNENFFNKDKKEVIDDYRDTIKYTLGEDCADTSHIEKLHDLGYLPIQIKALKEGTLVPMKVPVFTIENTHKEFYWLTNFLETLISACIWKPITTTTISKRYRDICEHWADKTADSKAHIQWQCHNFSYRGMSGNEDAITTGAGHLLFFTGTDTIPSIQYLRDYYNADIKELIGASVKATEHSIQTQYQDDYRYIKRMITEVAPQGIVSVVSDGYDYWEVIANVIPSLKQEIMNRDGKVVIRPDSGDPTKIICGDAESEDELVRKGSVEAL